MRNLIFISLFIHSIWLNTEIKMWFNIFWAFCWNLTPKCLNKKKNMNWSQWLFLFNCPLKCCSWCGLISKVIILNFSTQKDSSYSLLLSLILPSMLEFSSWFDPIPLKSIKFAQLLSQFKRLGCYQNLLEIIWKYDILHYLCCLMS